jgi:enterobacterial common antigen flippase
MRVPTDILSDVSNSERDDRFYAQPEPGKEVARRAWTTKRAALITTGANLLISVIGVCTGVLAARLLGPKGRGELAAIQAWPVALASLGMLGTSEALVYFSARDREQRSGYLSACFLIGSVGALVCSIAGFIAMPWLLKAQGPVVIWGARIFLAQIWLYLAIVMPVELLRAAGRFLAWNVLRVCPMVLWMAILLAAWIAGVRHPVPLAVASVSLSWLILLPLVPMVRAEVPRLALPSRTQLADVLRFGLPAVGSLAPRMMNFKLDQILMAALMPPVLLGQYVVAGAWSGASTPFVTGLSAVLVPDLAGRSDVANQGEALARVSRVASLIAVSFAVALLATAAIGIPFFFGTKFRPAVQAAEILALAGGVSGFNAVLSEGTRGLGRPAALLRAELLALVVTVVGLWLFLRPFGIIGAATVSLAAYSCTTLWLLVEARAVTGVSMLEFTIPQWRDIRLLNAHLCEMVKSLIDSIQRIRADSAVLPIPENNDAPR